MKKLFLALFAVMMAYSAFATLHVVTVQNFSFTPANLTITQGDTVRWNNIAGSHNVNGTQASYPNNPASFGNNVAPAPWNYQFVFTVAGNYTYRCNPHPNSMIGTITVQPGASPVTGMVITEIYYNAPNFGADTIEYIELYNNTNAAIDLTGCAFTRGITYTFTPGTTVAANDYIVVCNNDTSFFGFFGFYPQQWIPGPTNFNALSNNGEAIVIRDALGNVIDSVDYENMAPWPAQPNAFGPSLVLCDPNSNNLLPANWSASTTPTGQLVNALEVLGSPGADDDACIIQVGPILEFISPSVAYDEDHGTFTVEVGITNPNANPTNVMLMVEVTSTATFPDDYTGNPMVILTFPANSNTPQTATFTIEDDLMIEGTETIDLMLMAPDNNATIAGTGMITVEILDNDPASQAITGVVITEIFYNQPDVQNDTLEFFELYNTNNTSVDMTGAQIVNGVVHTFGNVSIPAQDYLIVSRSAASIQAAFGLPSVQWTSGALENAGETLTLIDALGNLIDSVAYDDAAPWVVSPDGDGPSLVLCDYAADNNNAANWFASTTPTGVVPVAIEILASPGAEDAACNPVAPELCFTANLVTVNENAGTITIGVSITNPNASPTTVSISIQANGTTATAGSDFTFTNPTNVTFPAGSTQNQTFTINITNDMLSESNETIVLVLGNPTNDATLCATSTYTINIIDNDPIGLNSAEGLAAFNLYPNPVSETLTLDLSQAENPVTVQLTNVLGQTVTNVTLLPGIQQLSTAELATGLYLVRLTDTVTGATAVRQIAKD